ncbi:MAG: metal-dependent hydrolase [Nanoarchaeota archaeon]|nr:metal-dependent hydrolase [Nanoarchaeota archaeon]
MKITYLGHASFLIESGKKILIDPFLSGNPKATAKPSEIEADIILVTHGHGDHLGDTVEIVKNTGAKVVAIHEIQQFLLKQGVNAIGMNIGGSIEIDGIKITMVPAIHSSSFDDKYMGHPAGFVIRFSDGIVYHAGDTGIFWDMKLIHELYSPDIAILPIGDVYTMGPKEAAKAVELIKPKIVIPMHYGTFPVLTGTPEKFKKLVSDAEVLVFEIGETKEVKL